MTASAAHNNGQFSSAKPPQPLHSGVFSGRPRFTGGFVRRHSLSMALIALLVVQSVAYHLTEMPNWVGNQQTHGQPARLWPDYWRHYSAQWLVSVLADTYGALLLVLFSKWFFEQGSSESEGSRGEREARNGA